MARVQFRIGNRRLSQFLTNLSPVPNSSAMNRNISENDSFESERYRKLYTMLLDAIPSSVLMLDRDLRIVSANRNFLIKSRRTSLDTLGRRLADIFPAVILNRMNIPAQIAAVFESNVAASGHRMSYRAPGMPMRVYYYRIYPFSWKGIVESVMLLMDDVTEQIRLSEEVRRVERHLASIIDSASDIILSTDTDGKILSWNPAAENISEYPFMEVNGRALSDFITTDKLPEIEKVYSAMLKGKESQMAEWDLITKSGAGIRVFWVFSPMKDESSITTGIVAVGRDLTERKKLEAHLLKSQKFAALGVMAGGIAHEIRNPLAICSSAAQFLLEDNINDDFRKDCAEKIHTGIQRASIIIENLLRFARPSCKSQMETVDLNALVEDTIPLIYNQAKIQKIVIKTSIPEKPLFIVGNSSLLQQVLINLFLNAIQAMPDGGTIRLAIEPARTEALIHVTDSGQGISKKDIDKIFDPFYTTSPVGRGSGLGLSISYSIIKQHMGNIEMESREGKGCTFTVRLPIN